MFIGITMTLVFLGFVIWYSKFSDKQERERREARQKELDAIKARADQALQGPTVNLNVNGGPSEALRMAQVKCVQCGASIEPGMKFCGHCGTQVPDDAIHADIHINDPARVEAVKQQARIDKIRASNQRIVAQAEAARIKAQTRKMKAAERKGMAQRIFGWFLIGVSAFIAIMGFLNPKEYGVFIMIAGLGVGAGIVALVTSRM